MAIDFEIKENIAMITLNRPNHGNSYNLDAIKEFIHIFTELKKYKQINVVLLKGTGKNFCTGADLSWLQKAEKSDYKLLLKMYQLMNQCELPIIASVQGKVLGGGVGLTAVNDIVLAHYDTTFTLSEAKWGLVPGIISPLVARKIGYSRFIYYSLTGKEVSSTEALQDGLIHFSGTPKQVEEFLQESLQNLQRNSLASLKSIKKDCRAFHPITLKQWQNFALASINAKNKKDTQARLIEFLSKSRSKQ